MLPGVEIENSSDKEDQNITTESLKMIVINVCDGDKVAILIINIEWVTTFSRHLNFGDFCK